MAGHARTVRLLVDDLQSVQGVDKCRYHHQMLNRDSSKAAAHSTAALKKVASAI